MAAVPEIDQIREILEWIGFANNPDRTSIIQSAFEEYTDIQSLNEKDITELSESFSRCTATNVRIDFRICRARRMKCMIYWVHDFYYVSTVPSKDRLDQATFLAAITIAGQRADMRKQLKDQYDKKAKVASLELLVSGSKWAEWEPTFSNYSSTLLGIHGTSYLT